MSASRRLLVLALAAIAAFAALPATLAAQVPLMVGRPATGRLLPSDPTFPDSTHYKLYAFVGNRGDTVTAELTSDDFLFAASVEQDRESQIPRWAGYELIQRPAWKWWFIFYVSLALGFLTDAQREVMALRYEQSLDYDNIAEILGIRSGAARALAHRAKATLLEKLGSEVWITKQL